MEPACASESGRRAFAESAIALRPAERRNALARFWLLALIAALAVASVTGVLAFCYPVTLGPLRASVLLAHDVSGDLAVLASLGYLWLHLGRVWGLRRKALSWRTGLIGLGLWAVASLTGIYGQFRPLADSYALWLAHAVASVAFILLACFHGLWGLRVRPLRGKES